MTTLQQAATALMDAMVKTDFTCRLGEQLDALEKALEAEQAHAVEPVATVQCVRGVTFGYLDVMQPVGTKLYTHPAPPPATGEREELIKRLRDYEEDDNNKQAMSDAADMLEADVSLINEGNKAQQVTCQIYGHVVGACVECSMETEAQQVAVPEIGNATCNPHPDAPHGFNRNASHSADRYVCDCEGWIQDWTNDWSES